MTRKELVQQRAKVRLDNLKKQKDEVKHALKDGLINLVTGLGTNRSKRSYHQWQLTNLSNFIEFEAAYTESWLVRQVVDTIPADATREWRELNCIDADTIRREEDRLQLPQKFKEAFSWARLYGGAGIVMITDQPLDQPLNIDKIKKGSLKRLMVLDRWELQPGDVPQLDLLSEEFLSPSFYRLGSLAKDPTKDSLESNGLAIIHQSHVVRLLGEPLPLRLSRVMQGWGDSSIRTVLQTIQDLEASIGGVAESLQEFNLDVITREDLMNDLETDQEDNVLKRFELYGLQKSIQKISLLDSTEQLQRHSLTYTGVADMIIMLMRMVSGASRTPMTKLFGESPNGLNASGEGDLNNYYDYVRGLQATRLEPALAKLDKVLVRSALGHNVDDFNYEWRSLKKPSPREEADAKRVNADADMQYLDSGIIKASQIMRNLQTKGTYAFDEEDIQEVERLENEIGVDNLALDGLLMGHDEAGMSSQQSLGVSSDSDSDSDSDTQGAPRGSTKTTLTPETILSQKGEQIAKPRATTGRTTQSSFSRRDYYEQGSISPDRRRKLGARYDRDERAREDDRSRFRTRWYEERRR